MFSFSLLSLVDGFVTIFELPQLKRRLSTFSFSLIYVQHGMTLGLLILYAHRVAPLSD